MILCLRNENSSGVRGGKHYSPDTLGRSSSLPALSLPKKKAPIHGAGDGDVLIESAQVGLEQMSNIADRITDFCRDGVIRVNRNRH